MLQMKKPDGSFLFNVLTIEMICALCKEAGNFDCKHMNRLPPWKTSERAELVKTLMANDAAMYQREQLGIVTTSDTAAFDGVALDRFSLSRLMLSSTNPEAGDVYLSYDPCGGGASAAALTFGYTDTVTKAWIICGADAQQLTSDGAQEAFVKKNLEAFRALPGMGSVRIIAIIEVRTRCMMS